MAKRPGIMEAGWVLGVALVAAGCDLEVDLIEDGGAIEVPRKGGNGAGGGGGGSGGTWIGNGLVAIDLSDVSPAHRLDSPAGLSPDAASLQTATYLVECALPEGDSVTKAIAGQTVVLDGALGLAPEWKDEPCDEACQEWVSACLLARVNVTGQFVALWLAAENPAIGLGHDPSLPIYEATFYGNVFQGQRYVCRGPQSGELGDYLDDRTCGGAALSDCGFTDWGACGAADRCHSASGFDVDCAAGLVPSDASRYASISTYVTRDAW